MNKDNLVYRWRKKRGLSQAAAAKALGYSSYVSVSYWETGRRKIPTRVLISMKNIG